MMLTTRKLAPVFLLLNIALVAVIWASPVHAQDVVGVANKAADDMMDRGILGVIVVVEALVIVTLFGLSYTERKAAVADMKAQATAYAEELKALHERVVTWATKATEIQANTLAELKSTTTIVASNTEALRASTAAIARSDAIASTNVERSR
jgi:hypothetical protein